MAILSKRQPPTGSWDFLPAAPLSLGRVTDMSNVLLIQHSRVPRCSVKAMNVGDSPANRPRDVTVELMVKSALSVSSSSLRDAVYVTTKILPNSLEISPELGKGNV